MESTLDEKELGRLRLGVWGLGLGVFQALGACLRTASGPLPADQPARGRRARWGGAIGAVWLATMAGADGFFETYPDGSRPVRREQDAPVWAASPLAPAPGQPAGALSGRLVFTSAGHGWTFNNTTKAWYTQRGITHEMVEDYGNLDQMTLFAYYCFNAGATVIPMRPVGQQTNEVVLDNDAPEARFVGAWSNSSSTLFYGRAGDVPYRFAALAATETATAIYAPDLPADGYYPVYTWVRHGSDRTFQLYRIRHPGGEVAVRVPHHLVGNGWVYLGTYWFRAGRNEATGAVIVSNLQPDDPGGTVAIADAIRFGNGMGDVQPEPGAARSTYPREEEASRYWVAASLGQGQSTSLYDTSLEDGSDNVGTPPRMAREMNREGAGTATQRLLISFHSNAGGGRGVIGLYNNDLLFPGTATPHQLRLAQLVGLEINNDLVAIPAPPLESRWFNRGSNLTYARNDYAFGEIRHDTLGGEMDATIIEVAFHDNLEDARLMRDPKVRNWVARAAYQAVVRYMNEFDGGLLAFLPEPPASPRAGAASGGGVRLSWSTPGAGGGSVAGYRIYRSADGRSFGSPVEVGGATTTNVVLVDVAAQEAGYFRVTAFNAGGESMPSAVVGCRPGGPDVPRVLVVNGFDRFDRALSPRQSPVPGQYRPPGPSGTIDRAIPRLMNAFDYVAPHGQALQACGVAFDSCPNESVANGQVRLSDYPVVIWALGRESTADETFSAVEQSLVRAYAEGGGHLFVSGTEVAWDLDRASGPSEADRRFLREVLRAALNGDANDDAGTSRFAAVAGGVFSGRPPGQFDDGTHGIYFADYPDVLTPVGPGAGVSLLYTGGLGGGAAVHYDGSAGGGRVVFLGFPFETILDPALRAALMFDALEFFGALPAPRLAVPKAFVSIGQVLLEWPAVPDQRYQVQWKHALDDPLWTSLGLPVTTGDGVARFADSTIPPGTSQRYYRVVWLP